jgi:pentatricopeptide repeat protein
MLASYPKMSMVAYTSFVEQFACRGDVVGAQRVLQRMITDGYKPDCFCYTSLMKAYARQNNLAAVWHVYRDMLVNKVELNVVTYTAMIRWFTSTGDQESLSVCLREMRLRGVRPNTVTCNTLIWALARVGDYQRAAIVYRDMLRQRLHPDAFTYTWLFNASHPRALLGIDDEDLISGTNEKTDTSSMHPTATGTTTTTRTSKNSFNNSNTNWYQRGLYVLGWFRDMQQLGIRPARQSIYAVAMSTLLRAGMYRGVLEVGDALVQHGITPSDYVFDMCRQARLRIDEYEASLYANNDETSLNMNDNDGTESTCHSSSSNIVDTPKTLSSLLSSSSNSVAISSTGRHGRTPLQQGQLSRRRKPSHFASMSSTNTSTTTSSPFTSSIIAQLNNLNATLNNSSDGDHHSSTASSFLSQAGSVFTARASTLARPEARLNAPTLLSKIAISRLPLNERIRIRRYCTLSP